MEAQQVVPLQHWLQMIHQCSILKVNFALHACAVETDLLNHVIIQITDNVLEAFQHLYVGNVTACIPWAHTPSFEVPSSTTPQKGKSQKPLDISSQLRQFIQTNGPRQDLLSWIQVFYSKTKCGVAGITQYDAFLRACTQLLWHGSKTLWYKQTMNNLLLNFFIGWKLTKWAGLHGEDLYPLFLHAS